MEDLGRKLEGARTSYAKAFGQLYQGRGNLIKQAKDFEQLGVAVKGTLPQYLVDKAELELELLPPSSAGLHEDSDSGGLGDEVADEGRAA